MNDFNPDRYRKVGMRPEMTAPYGAGLREYSIQAFVSKMNFAEIEQRMAAVSPEHLWDKWRETAPEIVNLWSLKRTTMTTPTKAHYHVRSACGVTIDWLETKGAALALATEEGLQVYELIGDRSTRIYPVA